MQLAHESLQPYQGLHGIDGLCHVRVYEQPGRLPLAIAGALDDNPGTSITNAIEMVAKAIQENVLTDGREFELIEHYPGSLGDPTTPSFARVRFQHRNVDEDSDDPAHYAGTVILIDGDEHAHVAKRREIEGDFRDPGWEPIENIEQLLGCEIAVWPEGQYTALAVAGEEGKRLRDEVAERATEASKRLLDAIELEE